MYALMITFRSQIPTTQLAEPFEQYAHELCKQPGLISKAWIQNGDTVGGFHLFNNKATADAYVSSDLAAGLQAIDGFEDFDVRGFDVLEDLSTITGVPAMQALAAQR